jgi:hypothetical protein
VVLLQQLLMVEPLQQLLLVLQQLLGYKEGSCSSLCVDRVVLFLFLLTAMTIYNVNAMVVVMRSTKLGRGDRCRRHVYVNILPPMLVASKFQRL